MSNSLGLNHRTITDDEIDAMAKIFFAANMVNIASVEIDANFVSIPKSGSEVLKRLCGHLRFLLDARLEKEKNSARLAELGEDADEGAS